MVLATRTARLLVGALSLLAPGVGSAPLPKRRQPNPQLRRVQMEAGDADHRRGFPRLDESADAQVERIHAAQAKRERRKARNLRLLKVIGHGE